MNGQHSILPTGYLLRPCDLYPYVKTAADYLLGQQHAIEKKIIAFPNLNWNLPWECVVVAPLKVSDSCWQLVCPCGNYPSYDPTWQLACCYSCGAIYRQPPPAEWELVQQVLIQRKKHHQRHWLVGETLADLIAENLAHGDAVPQEVLATVEAN